jgi:hypothetical protein
VKKLSVFRARETPFSLEYSQQAPAGTRLNSNSFFEIESDAWEFTDVFSGRNPLRNLGRYYLFPIEDYYCRDFIIDAAYKNGKLFLQRHPDDATTQQTEGYGINFERLMTSGGHPGIYASYQYVTYNIGEHSLMVRCEIDCVSEEGSDETINLTTKKLKRKKYGKGYYPLGNPGYFQEQWIQLVFTGASSLLVGSRDEGQYDSGVATIQQVQGFTRKQVAKLGEIDETKQRMVFEGLQTSLRWIRNSFKTIKETGEEFCAPSGILQAQIVFNKSKGEKSLEFNILKLSEHVDIVSESIAENLQGLVPVRWF